jgi:hypothetical protein
MVALRLVRLIEGHSDQIARDLAAKLQFSTRTAGLRKVPQAELVNALHELLQHLSEWLLTKTEGDVEKRYREIAARRAQQGVSLSSTCWAVVITKEYLWDFLQKQGFLRNPIELYGEMELLCVMNQFFDRALCFIIEGYAEGKPTEVEAAPRKRSREFNPAAFVP